MLLQRLLALLVALFSLPVIDDAGGGDGNDDGDRGDDDGGKGASAAGDGDDDDDGGDDDDDDSLESLVERAGSPSPTPEEIEAAKREKEQGRRDELLEEQRTTRRLLESRLPPPAPQQDPQEQADLQAIADAEASGDANRINGAKWAYNTNRINRENERKANMALFMAQETADKNEFREAGREDPKLFAKYKDRVEAKLAELRRAGQSIPRTTLYDWMVGRDIREARSKGKVKHRSANRGSDGVQRAERGGSPAGARSDVSRRGNSMTEHQKREKRLENQRI